ncbi:MAG: hypothetical protein AAGU06_03700 [Candidatus Shapirobacteria bacterium]
MKKSKVKLKIKLKTNKQKYTITSPSNWLNKIGVKIDENGKMILSMKFVLIPISIASEELEKYKEELLWGEKIKIIQSIALNVRNAETKYFESWSQSIIMANQNFPSTFPCSECFSKTMSPSHLRLISNSELSKLREEVNNKIIHVTENNKILIPSLIDQAKQYYDAFLKMNLFHFPEIKNMPILFCKKHEITNK